MGVFGGSAPSGRVRGDVPSVDGAGKTFRGPGRRTGPWGFLVGERWPGGIRESTDPFSDWRTTPPCNSVSQRGTDSSAEAANARHAPKQAKISVNNAAIRLGDLTSSLPRCISCTIQVTRGVILLFPVIAIFAAFHVGADDKGRKRPLSSSGDSPWVRPALVSGPALTGAFSTMIIVDWGQLSVATRGKRARTGRGDKLGGTSLKPNKTSVWALYGKR